MAPVPEELRSRIGIIKDTLKGLTTCENPAAIFIGGGAASGKSKIREQVIKPLLEFPVATIDCDLIKDKLPEYKKRLKIDSETAASYVHAKSKEIALEVIDNCILNRYSFIYDTSLAAPPNEYQGLILRLKEAGYKLIIIGVYAPVEVALIRAEIRYQRTHRYIPEKWLKYFHEQFPKTFFVLEPQFDQLQIWDNSMDHKAPILIAERVEQLEIYDEERYNEFRNRGVDHEKNGSKRTP